MKKHTNPKPGSGTQQVETLMERLRQTAYGNNAVSVFIPPVPFWIVCRKPETNEIGTAFLPASGQIPFLMIFVENIKVGELGTPVNVDLTIDMQFFNGTGYRRIVRLNKGYTRIADEIRIREGARVVLTVSDPDAVEGIWFGALYDIEVSKAAKYQVVMDDLIDIAEGKV